MRDTPRTSLEERWAAEIAAEQAEAERAQEEPVGASDERSEQAQELSQDTQAELATLRDQLMRKQAELVNYRRRTEKERLEQAEFGRAAVLRELLPLVDDLDRAVNADTDNPEAYRQGVELILRSLHEVLNRLGVEQIDPAGERFDPHLHEAVEHIPHDQAPAGHVVKVYKAGYRLGNRLLRPAMVSVSAGTDADAESADSPPASTEPTETSAD